MGIEFSYAAETAFVSPTLLKIGKKFFFNEVLQLSWTIERIAIEMNYVDVTFFTKKIYSDNTYYIILEFN